MSSASPAPTLESRRLQQAAGSSWHADLRTLAYYRDLVFVLVIKDLKVRYKNTVLGYAWSVLHPLAFAMIFFVVFRVFMRFQIEAYVLFLVSALFPWHWLTNCVNSAGSYFLNNRSLIRKVRFHRATLVVSSVLMELIHFAVSIPIIVAFMLYYGRSPSLDWLWWLPLLIVIQSLMTLGLSLLVATSNLFFRDLERLTRIVMQMMFYLTPVFFPVSKIPAQYEWILYANPFSSLMLCWRGLFYDCQVSPLLVAVALAWSLVALASGWAVYRAKEWRFAELV